MTNPYTYALDADPGRELREAREEVKRLTVERDVAVSVRDAVLVSLRNECADRARERENMIASYARKLEDSQGAWKELADRLTSERNLLVQQLNDVRREYCRRIACPLMDITDENDEDRMEWKAREIADKFKWDCFGGQK